MAENWGVFEEEIGVFDQDNRPITHLRLEGYSDEEQAIKASFTIEPRFGGELFTYRVHK